METVARRHAPMDFMSAAEDVITFLQERLGMGMWAVARKEGGRWVALRVSDRSYRFDEGEVLQWVDTLDARMARGLGPNVVPDVEAVAPYATARIRKRLQVGSYIGMPLTTPTGELFGALCAMDPHVQPPQIRNDEGLVRMLARTLEALLAADMRAMNDALRVERLKVESLSDPDTALGNRRYWMHLLTAEESRCKRYDHPASVFVLEIQANGSGLADGEMLARASSAMRRACRTHDVLARLGGNDLGLLAVRCLPSGVPVMTDRLRSALATEGIEVAIGASSRSESMALELAWQDADALKRRSSDAR